MDDVLVGVSEHIADVPSAEWCDVGDSGEMFELLYGRMLPGADGPNQVMIAIPYGGAKRATSEIYGRLAGLVQAAFDKYDRERA